MQSIHHHWNPFPDSHIIFNRFVDLWCFPLSFLSFLSFSFNSTVNCNHWLLSSLHLISCDPSMCDSSSELHLSFPSLQQFFDLIPWWVKSESNLCVWHVIHIDKSWKFSFTIMFTRSSFSCEFKSMFSHPLISVCVRSLSLTEKLLFPSHHRQEARRESVYWLRLVTVSHSLHHLLHWLVLLVSQGQGRRREHMCVCVCVCCVCDTHRHRHHYVQVTSGRSSKSSRRAEETVPSDERSLTEESHLIPAGFAGCSPAKIRWNSVTFHPICSFLFFVSLSPSLFSFPAFSALFFESQTLGPAVSLGYPLFFAFCLALVFRDPVSRGATHRFLR